MRRRARGSIACALLCGAVLAGPARPEATSARDTSAPATVPARATVAVGGLVRVPATLDLAALRALPAVEVASGAHRYSGPTLGSIVESAGIAADAGVRNDLIRLAVLVTGDDGYRALFSMGEVLPDYADGAVILAIARDGGPLDPADGIRVIASRDRKPSRNVARVVRVEVVRAQAAR